MTDFLRIAVTLLVAVSPAAAAAVAARAPSRISSRAAGVAAVVAVAAYLAAALVADWLLDAIDIEPETFRVSAGLVMAVGGLLAVVTGGAGNSEEWDGRWVPLFPLALPVLVTPAGLAATLSHSADGDTVEALGAALIAVGIAGAAVASNLGRYRAAADALARLSGALLVVFAGALIVDGVRAV
jgi:small neutral amino acid transporter SnatA (MarC family)